MPFEVLLAVYGLLLGFTLNEVLGGFSRAFKTARAGTAIRFGLLTPLLSTFAVIEITGFWIFGYQLRDAITGNHITLLSIFVIVGCYYVAASLIYPLKPEDWPDLDAWYDRQKKWVYGFMVGANLLGFFGQYVLAWTQSDAVEPVATTITIDEYGTPVEVAHAVPQAAGPPPIPEVSDTVMMIENVTLIALLAIIVALFFIRSRAVNVVLLFALIAVDLVAVYGRSVL